MISDNERSDEDSRLDEAPNGESKMDTQNSSNSKLNGNPDDGDESSVASTLKDMKSEAKDKEPSNYGKSKTKKKKKGAAASRLRDFRKSKGYDLFNQMSPPSDDIVEEEVVTHLIGSGKKSLLGKVWKNTNTGDYVRYRCYSYGIEYNIGDAVYIESQRPEQPFYICKIEEIKMTKGNSLTVHIKWFYRTHEIPEQMYQLLIQDRHTEHKTFSKLAKKAAAAEAANKEDSTKEDSTEKPKLKKLDKNMLRMRELFVSDASDIYPVSVLRGKCNVVQCSLISDLYAFDALQDCFFFILSYNPETRRLASTQGEIRVGASHQANCPEYTPDVPIEDRPDPDEEITWEPGRIHDTDLLMYIRASRSMAAFAAMCDGEPPEEGFVVATRDGIGLNAIQQLHESDYDTGKALQSLLKTPFPEYGGADPARKWPEEDLKEFIKGLRLYGKNFFKIRQECLPHRETPELVEFYYLWKKTPGAANNRPRGRRPRPGVMRRVKTGGKAGGKSNRNEDDPGDVSSCSEEHDTNDDENGDNGDLSPYYCRHCYTTASRDWHHAGKEKLLVCLDCRLYFKKYGELPCLEPNQAGEEEVSESSEEEEVDIKPPTDKKLDLKAIEQDSSEDPYVNGNTSTTEPVEIKGELPKSVGLVSPVPTMPAHVPKQEFNPASQNMMSPHHLPPTSSVSSMPHSSNLLVPPPAHSNSDVQILASKPPPGVQQPIPQPQPQQPQQPMIPREPSPPPKPDGTECHRSQSAIFTRQWNRGEGNSCSRTDLYFKPVPDSKLARKREERIRKANEKEDAMRAAQQAQEQAAKVARMDINPFDAFARRTPGSNSVPPSGPPGPGPLGMPPMGSPYGHLSEMVERERAVNAALAAAAGASPRPPYPRPPGTPGTPGPPGMSPHALSMETQRLEELIRRDAERQYAERMALATDPLVRLQMAGVNPEIPGSSLHPAYASLLAGHNPLAGGPRPPPGFDPRFRSPADLLMPRGPPGYPPRPPGQLPPDFLQRQLMLEREQQLRAASAHQLMAQQEEYLNSLSRLEQEARARQQASVSRP